MNSASKRLELTIITVVKTILKILKKTITGIDKRKPTILFFISIPFDANIALASKQNSTIPEHRKLITIGSFIFGIIINEKLFILSKIKELDIPKTEFKTKLEI